MANFFQYPSTVPTSSYPRVIRFGAFEVDIQAGELRKSGVKVRVQQQPFQVLLALLEHPGEVVRREDLHERLWPNDTFVDFEHGLNAAVKRLRDVLGESAERPVFIETLAKRGYRFIGTLNGHPASTPPVSGVEQLPKTKVLIFSAVIALAVLVTAIGVFLFLRSKQAAVSISDRVELRLTNNSLENPVTGAAISPDGKYLAYSDSTGLYLKAISTGETHALALPKGFVAMPAGWFPDGAHLLLSGVEPDHVERDLWSISVYGGSPSKLVDFALSASVSPDGQRIAFLRGAADWGGTGNEIWTVNSDGTNPQKIIARAEFTEMGGIAWAPDSRRIAYTYHYWGEHVASDKGIKIVALNGGVTTLMPASGGLASPLLWLPDGRLVYSFEEGPPNRGDCNLWAAKIDASSHLSGEPVRLARNSGWIASLTMTSDGKHLAMLRNDLRDHVYVAQLSADQNQLRDSRRLTLIESSDIPSAWTLDNKAVLFQSDRNGHPEIFKQRIDQAQAELLATSPNNSLLPRLSPDGTEVIYESLPPGAPSNAELSIFAVPVPGGVPRKILSWNRVGNLECTRKPADFCLFHATSNNQTHFIRFDPHNGVTSVLPNIQTGEPTNWGLSPDGAYLAILHYYENSGQIVLYSIGDAKTRTLDVVGWSSLATIDWASDSKSLFVGTMSHSGRGALLRMTLDGKARVLQQATYPTLCGCPFWAIPSPDGKWVAINQPGGSSNAWELDF